MSHHSSIEHLSPDDRELVERIESRIIALEAIVFVGMSVVKQGDERKGFLLTVGTDNLAVGKAQAAVIVSILEKEELDNVDVRLVRGRGQG